MQLNWLETFQAAARTGSFTAAARELSFSQSAVSRQIQALENYLGIQLFRRGPGGVTLTPEGMRFQRLAACAT